MAFKLVEAVHPLCSVTAYTDPDKCEPDGYGSPLVRYANESMFECVTGKAFSSLELACPEESAED